MFKLYSQQQIVCEQIKKELIETPYLDNIYLNKKMFIAGEMGVGKTYIGTQAIVNYVHDNNTFGIIFSPTTVVKKWHKVLQDAIDTYHYDIQIQELKRNNMFVKNSVSDNEIELQKNTIYILTNNSLNVFATNNIGFLINTKQLPFMIFDEVHELKGAKLHGLEQFLMWDNQNMANAASTVDLSLKYQKYYSGDWDEQFNRKIPMLFLTGTIFNKSWRDIFELISLTHPRLFLNALHNGRDYTNLIEHSFFDYPAQHQLHIENDLLHRTFPNIFAFMNKVWQYISISLSLDDVKEVEQNDDNEVKQTIMPIKPFALTNEQQIFLNVARTQLSRLGSSNVETKIMNWIDYPAKSLLFKKNTHVRKTRIKNSLYNFASFPLIPIPLDKTVKYKKMMSILQQHQKDEHKRFLIYANDPALIKQLVQALSKQGYKTFSLPTSLSAKKYGEYIKEQYNSGYEVGIVQPNKISVGIDIEADYLIWYQLINDYSKMLQATRRVYRLNSTRKSLVYFLIYEDTQQEAIVNELSNSTKNNAATYGEQSKDNLTKITGILLNNI